MNYIRLPLAGAYNIRELGGYGCGNGSMTSWHTFLRADCLTFLKPADIAFLKTYGLKHVIDLRSPEEVRMMPHPFKPEDGITYINIPLRTEEMQAADLTKVEAIGDENFIAKSYVSIAEQAKPVVKELFEYICGCEPGCILFHCMAGKDRTGILAALLLGLAGVGKADILANYQVTFTYIKENPTLMQYANEMNAEVLYSKMEYMEYFVNHIETEYGGCREYLLSTGIAEEKLELILERMICNG